MTDELVIRQRLKGDLEYFARNCLKIRPKEGGLVPLQLNSAQRHIHRLLEEQWAEREMVRAVILKGRQQGSSTYVQARFYHKITHARGLQAFILTHRDQSTQTIFKMAERYYQNCPPQVRPEIQLANAKELSFKKLDSGYRVATAGAKGAGRSDTVQFFHGSECAFWPNAEDHAAGALQTVPRKGSEVILESTSVGPRGLFYKYWKDAVEGKSEYIPIFVPWYWQDEYRADPSADFELTAEEIRYQGEYGLDAMQIAWRRGKISELHGVHRFRREYPATPEEAWSAEVPGALWTRKMIEDHRREAAPAPKVAAIVLDPSTTDSDTSDEWGIVWGWSGNDGHAYIMGDDSAILSPLKAARSAVHRLRGNDLDLVIYETNQGGDMIPTIIHSVDDHVVCKGVRASRGKRARAEPVAALYEQGKVHHVGELPLLEDEMCTWDASRSNQSPNRIDAVTYLVTYLLLGHKNVVLL